MGKGGTKFEGEAIGVRGTGKRRGVSMKERKKEMEVFKETGVHPGIEETRQRYEIEGYLASLPLT